MSARSRRDVTSRRSRGVGSRLGSFRRLGSLSAVDVSLRGEREKELAIVTATLANAKLQSSEALAAYYATLTEDLARQRDALLSRAGDREDDVRALTSAYERQLVSLLDERRRLEAEVSAAFARGRAAAAAEADALRAEVSDGAAAVAALTARVAFLERDAERVAAFRAERDAHEASLAALRNARDADGARHGAALREVRLARMAERVRLRAEREAQDERRAADVRETALALRDASARETAAQHADLRRACAALVAERSALEERAAAADVRQTALRRAAALASGAAAAAAAGGARARREIAALRSQLRAAEGANAAAAAQFAARVASDSAAHEAAARGLAAERDAARSCAAATRRELVRLRGVARELLARRTALEGFFHDALDEVRRARLAERRGETARRPPALTASAAEYTRLLPRMQRETLLISDGRSNPTPEEAKTPTLPLIPIGHGNGADGWGGWGAKEHGPLQTTSETLLDGPFDHSTFASIPNAPKLKDLQSVEISQLSWRDKERVLQLLFRKLQGKTNPKPCAVADEMDSLSSVIAVDPKANTFLTE